MQHRKDLSKTQSHQLDNHNLQRPALQGGWTQSLQLGLSFCALGPHRLFRRASLSRHLPCSRLLDGFLPLSGSRPYSVAAATVPAAALPAPDHARFLRARSHPTSVPLPHGHCLCLGSLHLRYLPSDCFLLLPLQHLPLPFPQGELGPPWPPQPYCLHTALTELCSH